MSILGFLKKFKLPSFEDDFIQDPTENVAEDAPVSYGAKIVYDPHKDPEKLSERKNLRELLNDEWDRHSDPSDGASMSNLDIWEE